MNYGVVSSQQVFTKNTETQEEPRFPAFEIEFPKYKAYLERLKQKIIQLSGRMWRKMQLEK